MYYVTIKHIPTGEIQVCPMEGDWDDRGRWIWSEGNWSCDCNRLYEFRQAKGLERIPEEDSEFCRGCKEYTVVKVVTDAGKVIEGEPNAGEYGNHL